jgi:hypothetical protein
VIDDGRQSDLPWLRKMETMMTEFFDGLHSSWKGVVSSDREARECRNGQEARAFSSEEQTEA